MRRLRQSKLPGGERGESEMRARSEDMNASEVKFNVSCVGLWSG